MNTVITLKALDGMEKELREIFSQVDPTELMQVRYEYNDEGVTRHAIENEYYSNVVIDNLSRESIVIYMEELSKRNLLSEKLVRVSNDTKSNLLFLVRKLDKDLLDIYFKEVAKQPQLDKIRVRGGAEFDSLSWALIFRGEDLKANQIKEICECLYEGIINTHSLIFGDGMVSKTEYWDYDSEKSVMIAKMNDDIINGACELLRHYDDGRSTLASKISEAATAYIDFALSKKTVCPGGCFMYFFLAREMLDTSQYEAILKGKTKLKFSFENEDFDYFREYVMSESAVKTLTIADLSDLHDFIYNLKNPIMKEEKDKNIKMFIKLALVAVVQGKSTKEEYKEFAKKVQKNVKDEVGILGAVLDEVFNDRFLSKEKADISMNNIIKLTEGRVSKLVDFIIKEMNEYDDKGGFFSSIIQENKKAYISKVPIEMLNKYFQLYHKVNTELVGYTEKQSLELIEDALKYNYTVLPIEVEKEWLLFTSASPIDKKAVPKKLKI